MIDFIFSISLALLNDAKADKPYATKSPRQSTMSDSQRASYHAFNAIRRSLNLEVQLIFSEVIRRSNNAAAMYELANFYNEQKNLLMHCSLQGVSA